MKTLIALIFFLIFSAGLFSQPPQKMSYQAIVRNTEGELVREQQVGILISILEGSADGSAVYTETQTVQTNKNGLLSLEIGQNAGFGLIDWSAGDYYLKTEIDPSGGTAYSIRGTTQLLSVPYALYAKQAEEVKNAQMDGNAAAFDGWDKNEADDFDGQYTNLTGAPINLSSFNNDAGYLTMEGDSSITNELQDLGSVLRRGADAGNRKITNLADPSEPGDAVNKAYMEDATRQVWNRSGNDGTDPETDYLGTRDNQPLVFRINDMEKMRLDTTGTLSFSNIGCSVLLGQGAGMNNDLANNFNVFVGDSAGYANTSGHLNTANGSYALYSNTTGSDNTAGGYASLKYNTTGSFNTSYGIYSLYGNTIGTKNTAIGNNTLYSNIDGSYNSAFGYNAMLANKSGNKNVAMGSMALSVNTQGSFNTALGSYALAYNASGNGNTAIGKSAAFYSNRGNSNIAIGVSAQFSNIKISNIVAIGDSALYYNGGSTLSGSQGTKNTAVGSKALLDNRTGFGNTAVGFHSMKDNISGRFNSAFGDGSMISNTAGDYNSGFGESSLYSNRSGSGNTATGVYSLFENTNGINNSACGAYALQKNTTGNYNTAVGGYTLLNNADGDFNTACGFDAGPYSTSLTNTGAFGYGAYTYTSNTIRIGNSAISSIGGFVPWTNLSDGRFKTHVQTNVPGLTFIMKLRPVTFNWDLEKLEEHQGIRDSLRVNDAVMAVARKEKEEKLYTGFIAQEVEKAAAECGFDFSAIIRPGTEKDVYNLSYAEFVVPLVKAMQEQQQRIEALEAEIAAIKAEVER